MSVHLCAWFYSTVQIRDWQNWSKNDNVVEISFI